MRQERSLTAIFWANPVFRAEDKETGKEYVKEIQKSTFRQCLKLAFITR